MRAGDRLSAVLIISHFLMPLGYLRMWGRTLRDARRGKGDAKRFGFRVCRHLLRHRGSVTACTVTVIVPAMTAATDGLRAPGTQAGTGSP